MTELIAEFEFVHLTNAESFLQELASTTSESKQWHDPEKQRDRTTMKKLFDKQEPIPQRNYYQGSTRKRSSDNNETSDRSNLKLDPTRHLSIHEHEQTATIAQTQNPIHRSSDKPRLTLLRQPELIHELTSLCSYIVVRIFYPKCVKWNPVTQELLLKNPRRFIAKHVWHTPQRSEPLRIVTPADYSVYLYMGGLSVIHNYNTKFRFIPSRSYRKIFKESQIVVNQGIKLHLTHLAVSQKTLIPIGAYIGHLGIQNTFQVILA